MTSFGDRRLIKCALWGHPSVTRPAGVELKPQLSGLRRRQIFECAVTAILSDWSIAGDLEPVAGCDGGAEEEVHGSLFSLVQTPKNELFSDIYLYRRMLVILTSFEVMISYEPPLWRRLNSLIIKASRGKERAVEMREPT